jgi:hypothetical protein
MPWRQGRGAANFRIQIYAVGNQRGPECGFAGKWMTKGYGRESRLRSGIQSLLRAKATISVLSLSLGYRDQYGFLVKVLNKPEAWR